MSVSHIFRFIYTSTGHNALEVKAETDFFFPENSDSRFTLLTIKLKNKCPTERYLSEIDYFAVYVRLSADGLTGPFYNNLKVIFKLLLLKVTTQGAVVC